MTVQISDLSKAVLDTQYAVRGPIVARAHDLERQGREIIYCNIGNPQALEQKPLTYLRQVLAVCQYPDLVEKAPGTVCEGHLVPDVALVVDDPPWGGGGHASLGVALD